MYYKCPLLPQIWGEIYWDNYQSIYTKENFGLYMRINPNKVTNT